MSNTITAVNNPSSNSNFASSSDSTKFYETMTGLQGQMNDVDTEQFLLEQEFQRLWTSSRSPSGAPRANIPSVFSQAPAQEEEQTSDLHPHHASRSNDMNYYGPESCDREEMARRARNQHILDKIQELETNACIFAARSERLRLLRMEYDALKKYTTTNNGRSTVASGSSVINSGHPSHTTPSSAPTRRCVSVGVNTDITGPIRPSTPPLRLHQQAFNLPTSTWNPPDKVSSVHQHHQLLRTTSTTTLYPRTSQESLLSSRPSDISLLIPTASSSHQLIGGGDGHLLLPHKYLATSESHLFNNSDMDWKKPPPAFLIDISSTTECESQSQTLSIPQDQIRKKAKDVAQKPLIVPKEEMTVPRVEDENNGTCTSPSSSSTVPIANQTPKAPLIASPQVKENPARIHGSTSSLHYPPPGESGDANKARLINSGEEEEGIKSQDPGSTTAVEESDPDEEHSSMANNYNNDSTSHSMADSLMDSLHSKPTSDATEMRRITSEEKNVGELETKNESTTTHFNKGVRFLLKPEKEDGEREKATTGKLINESEMESHRVKMQLLNLIPSSDDDDEANHKSNNGAVVGLIQRIPPEESCGSSDDAMASSMSVNLSTSTKKDEVITKKEDPFIVPLEESPRHRILVQPAVFPEDEVKEVKTVIGREKDPSNPMNGSIARTSFQKKPIRVVRNGAASPLRTHRKNKGDGDSSKKVEVPPTTARFLGASKQIKKLKFNFDDDDDETESENSAANQRPLRGKPLNNQTGKATTTSTPRAMTKEELDAEFREFFD